MHKGFKLNVPARIYNMTVDHSKTILASTPGHPGTWNDKTLILFDEFICGVNDGKLYQDFTYDSCEKDENGLIIEVTYPGVWFIVDNVYLT